MLRTYKYLSIKFVLRDQSVTCSEETLHTMTSLHAPVGTYCRLNAHLKYIIDIFTRAIFFTVCRYFKCSRDP